MKKWLSPRPTECQICDRSFHDGMSFIDGRMLRGPWAIMCTSCHALHGSGLGTGSGQKYNWHTLEKEEG